MPYVEMPIDRYQLRMDNLDSMVAWDSMARVIDCFVDHIDLAGMGFERSKPNYEGRPCYDPRSMLKLYFYGYRNGIRSSRKLEKACKTNIEIMWMLGGLTPDFRTISDFRKDNVQNLKKVFKEFTRRVTVDLETGFVSVDGSKFRAVNSKDRNFTIMKMDDRIKWLEDRTLEYLRLLEQADVEEETEEVLTREDVQAKLDEAQARLEKYRRYRDYMEREKLTQLSLTDAESRLMKDKNGMTVSFNVQTAVDSETHMIMNYEVTNQATDHGMLTPTTEILKQDKGESILEVVADKGYHKVEDMVECLEKGIIPHVILPDGQDGYDLEVEYQAAENLHPESTDSEELKKCLHAGVIPEAYKDVIEAMEVVDARKEVEDENAPAPKSPYGTEEEMKARAAEGYFVRDPERDLVYCPGGETLRRKSIKSNGATRYANKHACKGCPFRGQCVSGAGITKWKEMDFGKDSLERKAKWFTGNDSLDEDGNQKNSNSENKPKNRRKKYKKVKVVRFILKPNRKKMEQRKCLSEHPFGTLKRAMGSPYFLLKGKTKTNGEFALLSMGYNLARAENLLGFSALMKKAMG